MASQITILTIVYSTVYSGADKRKHQSSVLLAFVWGIHQWPMNSRYTMASNSENVSIWWHYHDMIISTYQLLGTASTFVNGSSLTLVASGTQYN